MQLILSTLGTLKLQPFQNGTHRFLLFLSVICAFLLVSLSLILFLAALGLHCAVQLLQTLEPAGFSSRVVSCPVMWALEPAGSVVVVRVFAPRNAGSSLTRDQTRICPLHQKVDF